MSLSFSAARVRGTLRRRFARVVISVAAPAVVAAPLTLAGAAPAQAATAATWDRLAHCESSGRWHINTGNGFYGGLQFTASTWRAYGGGRYASRADHASRVQQIYIAQRVLRGQGWGAWPGCTRKLHLTRADARGAAFGAATRSVSVSRSARRPAAARYVVHSGDTLSRIAVRKHVRGGWRGLYALNTRTIGRNPNALHVGQRLRLR